MRNEPAKVITAGGGLNDKLEELAHVGTAPELPLAAYYSRAGNGPGAVHEAAIRAEQASHALLLAVKAADGETSLAGCLHPAGQIRIAVRTLAGCLAAEARITAAALTADPSVPEPAAATAARRDLQYAARRAGAAGSDVFDAWRALRRCVSESDGGGPGAASALGKSAAAAASVIGELDALLRRDSQRAVPATLPMIAGHAHITEHLALALHCLGSSCIALAGTVRGSAPRARRRENTITAPLHHAGETLRHSGRAAAKAHDVLSDAAAIIRSAPSR